MRGRRVAISSSRRFVIDLMRYARRVPFVSLARPLNIAPLVAARAQCKERPSWFAIWAKAQALVAQEIPELRRVYVKLPWPQLYEYPRSVAAVAIEREHDGVPAIFPTRINSPEDWPLADIHRMIWRAKTATADTDPYLRRTLRLTRMPFPLRQMLWWIGLNTGRHRANHFGTFVINGVSGQGIEDQDTLTIGPYNLTFGSIGSDGRVNVRLKWDHRIMDAALVARALARLEQVLNGPIAQELRER